MALTYFAPEVSLQPWHGSRWWMGYSSPKDIFGRRAANHYYAVVVNLGNNTGFDLQINKIGFITTKTMQVADFDENGKPVFENGKVRMRNDLLPITAIDQLGFGGRWLLASAFSSNCLPPERAIDYCRIQLPAKSFTRFTNLNSLTAVSVPGSSRGLNQGPPIPTSLERKPDEKRS